MMTRALLRLTPATEKALKHAWTTQKIQPYKCLEKSVRKYFQLAITEDFKEAYSRGMTSLQAARWNRRAELTGLLSKEKVSAKTRIRVGTVISDETRDQLKLLMAWCGKSRQAVLDACLARYLDTPSAPRPKSGSLSEFFFPLLSGSRHLTQVRLRWLVEHEFI